MIQPPPKEIGQIPSAPPIAKENTRDSAASKLSLPLVTLGSASLAACGGGGDSSNPTPGPAPTPTPRNLTAIHGIDPAAATKFLSQASMGGGQTDFENVQIDGYDVWIEKQFEMPRTMPCLFDWMRERGFETNESEIFRGDSAGIDDAVWRSFIISNDTLRQRVGFALSQILVVGITGLNSYFRGFGTAGYMDILLNHAFGNYRDLLEAVSRSPVMANYLTFLGNRKSINGSLPDENYAREILQLFSIGLHELNPDGSEKLVSGKPVETYDTDDIMGLARVFTGWVADMSVSPYKPYTRSNGTTQNAPSNAEYLRRPMIQNAALYETGEKSFLGKTIPAGTTADAALKQALDIIFNHPNVGPFIGKQLIQRLVKSNPSAAYVGRVAAAFNSGKFGRFGSGKRGDMKSVISAILLDAESKTTGTVGDKLREPVLRLTQWARAFKLTSPNDKWRIGNISAKASGLGQAAMRSPSVFNFFRPGYVPPNTRIASFKLTAPEFQITDDVSVGGYLNYIQSIIPLGIREVGSNPAVYYKPDYSTLIPLVDTPADLVNQVNLVMTGGRLPEEQEAMLAYAISKIPATTEDGKMKRIHAAVTLLMASSAFLVLN